MNRAFISLYALIVGSILLIGWALNFLWDSVEAGAEVQNDEMQSLFFLLEESLDKNPKAINDFNLSSAIQVSLIDMDLMVGAEALDELQQGKIINASDDDRLFWYKRWDNNNKIIMLAKPKKEPPWLYRGLLIGFYVALALVIYLWVWPLSRDAKKLEQQTRFLAEDNLPQALNLSANSTLYPVAASFNVMLQQLRELIISHQEMTNAISHELRTPLARMKFALALLDDKKLDAKDQQQLASLATDIHEMESLINTLLLYAGFEHQRYKLELTKGSMRDFLDTLVAKLPGYSSKNLELQIVDHSQGQDFCCEWKLMERVLHNLLLNAARYATQKIVIQLGVNEQHFWIWVEDDGPGIAPEDRERVFDSFVRLYNQQQDKAASGFGLGLAIVKRIMQWHKGQVLVQDSVDLKGASFRLIWPVSYPDH